MSEARAVKGMEVKFHIFKAWVLGRGEWPVSRTGLLYSWEIKNIIEYKDVQTPERTCTWWRRETFGLVEVRWNSPWWAVTLLCQLDFFLARSRGRYIGHQQIFFNPLVVTICPETFSNLCVDSVRDM